MQRYGWLSVWVGISISCGGSQKEAATRPVAAPEGEEVPSTPEDPHAGHGEHLAGPAMTLDGLAEGAQLIDDLGTHHRDITTASKEAAAYFDQGLRLTYGFNHDEAARSFAKAGKLDPGCALCWWGAAYTLGPNYNIPMLPDRAAAAWDALERARAASPKATPVEQGLIMALSRRYKGPEYVDPVAMQAFNVAFADAMREVARRHPADDDVQVLYAEALMNVNPWKLWSVDGEPAAGTPEIVAALERVLSRTPGHPGANHYYIHAVEASKEPGKAVPAADRLGGLMPAAGHTVHMPAHIYQRVGRYADASESNRRAVAADNALIAKLPPVGYYPFYLAHNYGFLAYSSSMEGRAEEALAASKKSAESMPRDVVCGMPGMDFFLSEPLLVMVRFGRWEDVMAAPKPDAKYQTLVALWHHAQGMALAATGKAADARAHLDAVTKLRTEIPEDQLAGLNAGRLVLSLAAKSLEARIAEADRDARAIELWEQAVAIEDQLAYNEPADWFYPTRHYLGAALLDAGRAKEAEAVYRADLERHPQNGWALFGVWKATEAQKKSRSDVKSARVAFEKAWKRADVQLTRSAF